MSIEKATDVGALPAAEATQPAVTPAKGSLFRRIDWITFLITFLSVWIGYVLTLAPEVTLEDSGELAVGSMYAGIPHPPGYPVWTIYTWLWTVLVPFGNMAWRVGLGVATSGAIAAGLLGLMVSRGSSLLIEGIEDLKLMRGNWQKAICVVAGFVAGNLIGFNGFMWSQSVIVEVYPTSVASFMVTMVCLMHWIYYPERKRYLYWAMFFFGICFTNHQTLIVAAMGIEVAIAMADRRMGRSLFLGNSIIYLAGLLLKQQHLIPTLDQNPAIFAIFHVVGVASIVAYIGFIFLTKQGLSVLGRDLALTGAFLFLAAKPQLGTVSLFLALASLGLFVKFAIDTWRDSREWLVVILCGFCWIAGAAFYFYMPLAGMTNPPMQWGYPRTVEGFIHAFTRGQYEKANPTDIIGDPMRFVTQLGMLFTGIVEEFNWVYVFLALIPFLYFFKLHRRERAWLIGIAAIYLCLGVLLLILLNPPPDRAAQDLVRVFFGASHTMIAMLVGYGITITAACMATQYERFRHWGIGGACVAIGLALFTFAQHNSNLYFGDGAEVSTTQLFRLVARTFTNAEQFGLPVFAGLILIGMTFAFLGGLLVYKTKAPLAIALAMFTLMPVYSVMTHWANNEQRNHWFGYWFGHDMFTPPFGDGKEPIYPKMAKDAILFGGTDPGRFCPTYMIFAESFTPHKAQPKLDQTFDRRDVYIITQNALADGTYLCYIRAHYNRSQQIDPPFFQDLFRSSEERDKNLVTNRLAKAMAPLDRFFTRLGDSIEKRRRVGSSWFKPEDFTDLNSLVARLKPAPKREALAAFIYDHLSPDTSALIDKSGPTAEGRLRSALTMDLNNLIEMEHKIIRELRSKSMVLAGLHQAGLTNQAQTLEKELVAKSKTEPLFTPSKFASVKISDYLESFIRENPQGHSRIRLNRLLLEAAYPKEIAKSEGGVYPDREIYIPNQQDSSECFQAYVEDAKARLEHDIQFPNQPRRVKPNEDVRFENGKVQVAGQAAVMAINGLIAKVIFDKNPANEFYVEESFPLEWMYPHLTPYGVIMKVNREPLKELSEEVIARDHKFWKEYSKRLTGDFIDYNTSVKEVADFVERTYLRRDFAGFNGDRKFVRDDQAQKAFSKLRSAIAGMYAWRLANARPGSPEQHLMLREAEFAFKQAFAFCPYSPEAVYRYVNLLGQMNRLNDAMLVAQACQKLDPYNAQVEDMVKRLEAARSPQVEASLNQLEQAVRQNPTDFQAGLNLASLYLQAGRTSSAVAILDNIRQHPKAEVGAMRALLQAYGSISDTNRLRQTIARLELLAKSGVAPAEAALGASEGYRQLGEQAQVIRLLDQVIASPGADLNVILQAAQQYANMGDYGRLEKALQRLVQVAPDNPEGWYDLAALQASISKPKDALASLRKAVELSQLRRKTQPNARDLIEEARKDPRFQAMAQQPEFRQVIPAQ